MVPIASPSREISWATAGGSEPAAGRELRAAVPAESAAARSTAAASALPRKVPPLTHKPGDQAGNLTLRMVTHGNGRPRQRCGRPFEMGGHDPDRPGHGAV